MKLKSYGFIVLQLLVLGWFIRHFNLEVQFNLPLIFPMIILAFIVHSLVPLRYKTYVFILSTLAGLILILTIQEVIILVGIALAMIGVCNLPINLGLRKLIIIALGICLALVRAGVFPGWVPSNALIILASMFMFRMLLLLYELKYQKKPVPLLMQLSYFFMLPNIVFTLFPVVDLKLFRQNYFRSAAVEIYQRGIHLIAIGILQLYIYRLIYSFVIPPMNEVNSFSLLVTYIIFSYALIIRLAGIFNFSVGVLRLFGYDLPEVFDNLFLASGFSDLWRRINIYWKDFILKLYYYPMYFKFKRYGQQKAIVLATMLSFVITALLHSYQLFWLSGSFVVKDTDLVFWGVFGVAVAFGSLKQTTKKQHDNGWHASFTKSAKIVSTFLLISLLWSVWISPNMPAWLNLVSVAGTASLSELLKVSLIIGSIILIGAVVDRLMSKPKVTSTLYPNQIFGYFSFASLSVLVLAFNSYTLPIWTNALEGEKIQSVFHFTLNKQDRENQMASYYDDILSENSLMNPLNGSDHALSTRFEELLYERNILEDLDDARAKRLIPSASASIQGVDVKVNQWGMLDREYSLEVPPKTIRVALVGGSIEMGWMISIEQRFDKMIEEKLNAEDPLHGNYQYEVMNFSTPGRFLVSQVYAIQQDVLKFNPDLLVIFDHSDAEWIGLKKALIDRDYSRSLGGYLSELYEQENLATIKSFQQGSQILEKYKEGLFTDLYANIYEQCKKNGTKAVLIAMPEFRLDRYVEKQCQECDYAKNVGFEVIDLTNLFDRKNIKPYVLDFRGHPTQLAHPILTEALYPKFVDILEEKSAISQKVE